MKFEQFARLQMLFDAAIALPTQDRIRFAEANTPGEEALRAELVGMLNAHEDTHFLSARAEMPPSLLAGKVRPQAEQQIGIYRLLRELGRGGMGTVYLAVRSDDTFRKVVALKVMSPCAAQGDFVERFKQERQILAALDHPHIARILDGGATEDGLPYYVMEYVDGLPIDTFCDRARADVGERVRILAQVCDAVQYLHDQSLIHRDLKPGNILVTADGRPKLLDFGIAKVLTMTGLPGSTADSGQPTMLMTPVYASPEQIEGRTVTKSTDIYSLGVILYKLLTGGLPFVNDDGMHDLAAKLSGREPNPPSKGLLDVKNRTTQNAAEFRRRIHGDLDLVVLMALKTEHSRRYATAQIFGEDLRRCLDGHPVSAKADTAPYRFRKFVGRNKLAVALATALAIVAVVGAGLANQVQIEKTRISAKSDELDRYLSFLNARLDRWHTEPGSSSVSESEKIADVRRIRQILSSDIPQVAASPRGDPNHVKRLFANAVRWLDCAEHLAPDQAPVRKEIATAYREAGDLQATARAPQILDRHQAIASYQRAALILAGVGPADLTWVETQLTQLDGRLQALGSRLDRRLPQASASPPGTAPISPERHAPLPSVRVKSTSASASRATPALVVSATGSAGEASELRQRLDADWLKAEQARRNVASLQERLKTKGQEVHGDTLAAMSRAEGFLNRAEADLGDNRFRQARDNLERAEYELKKVFGVVGN